MPRLDRVGHSPIDPEDPDNEEKKALPYLRAIEIRKYRRENDADYARAK